ncbi:MAG: [FeFe] hydrogenase, group A [Lachnospirales bacterium]
MVNITINRFSISVPEGSTILEAARMADVHIPHLCYLKELNEIGACRLCCVEVEGEEKLLPACSNVVREGMNITTNSPRVRTACRTNLELIMSQHNCNCATCVRSGNCQLQTLANDFNIIDNPFEKDILSGKLANWNKDFPLIRDATKCVKCMRCVQVCNKVQTMNVWDLVATGSRTRVDVADYRCIEDADCTLCGQCVTHCPVGALQERDDLSEIIAALENPDITTVVQIAPAVRTAWGESLNLPPEQATVNKLAGVLRQIGFDYVFDTSYSADLTIMEEASEFIERFTKGELQQYPMFTSCCPGWVRFLKGQYPELVGQLSTSKSPQQMFGAVIKSFFAEKIGVPPSKICCVSIMPCLAKKSECDLPTMQYNGVKDVDYVLTSREVVRLIRSERIDVEKCWETPFDRIMGDYSGAGVIFGATGGVMEAALRSANYFVTGKNPAPEAFRAVRDEKRVPKPWREATFMMGDIELKVAVASGLGNARELCEAILRGQVKYDFVEVMACPGGCSGGGGQPIHCDDKERAHQRGKVLYKLDRGMPLRFSHENIDIQNLYKNYLGEPMGEKAEELLHTNHFSWKL